MTRTLEEMVQQVRQHAAQAAGVAVEDVEVKSAADVTWPDGSLGCPSPGGMYTQALVPGYRIIVAVGDRLLDYHASRRGHLVVCPAERAVEPGQRVGR